MHAQTATTVAADRGQTLSLRRLSYVAAAAAARYRYVAARRLSPLIRSIESVSGRIRRRS